MRNPERIDGVLDAIKKIWKKNPNLRLLQLLINIDCEPYYIEDVELIQKLKDFYEKEEKTESGDKFPAWGWSD